MSDSDDDAAFASADEGKPDESKPTVSAAVSSNAASTKLEEVTKPKNTKPENKNEGKGKNRKKKKGGGKNNSQEATKQSSSNQSKQDVTKTTDKITEIPETENVSSKLDSASNVQSDTQKQPEKGKSVNSQDNSESKSNILNTSVSPEKSKNSEVLTDNPSSPSSENKMSLKSGDSSETKEDIRNVVTESPGEESITRTVDKDATDTPVQQPQPQQSSGSWGWSSWGSSLLNTATTSVSTFTNQVGDGFHTLMDTVENTLGVPHPEDLVEQEQKEGNTENSASDERKEDKQELSKVENKSAESKDTKTAQEEPESKDSKPAIEESNNKDSKPVQEQSGAAGGSGWFSNISSLVQNTVSEGMGVLETIGSGGLDVMEKIGKKTYNVISEHDPGFRKARQFLSNKGDKPNLSATLREAKDLANKRMEFEKESAEACQCHFGFLFDEYQGLAHLEALEILSNQSEKKVQALLHAMSDDAIAEIKPQLMEIKEIFEIEDNDDDKKEHDFVKLITDQLTELHLGTSPDKLIKVHEKTRTAIANFDKKDTEKDTEKEESETVSGDSKEIYKVAIQSLADLSSKSVEQFHKAGELILLQTDTEKTFEERSTALAGLTQILCTEVGILATKFSECVDKVHVASDDGKEDVVNPVVNIYLEATNSSTYIQDAFQLLLPVLQHATIHKLYSQKD